MNALQLPDYVFKGSPFPSLSFWSKSRALKIFTLIIKTSCPMVTAVILHQEMPY